MQSVCDECGVHLLVLPYRAHPVSQVAPIPFVVQLQRRFSCLAKEQGGPHAVLPSESHLSDVGGDPLPLDALLTGMVGNKTKERSRGGEGPRDRGGAAG